MLSYAALFLGLASAVLLVFEPEIAAGLLLVHLLFDFFDGGLARYSKSDSDEGAFIDSSCDLMVVAAFTAALAFIGLVNGALAVIYVFLYVGDDVLAYVRNSLGSRSKVTLRPRLIIYAFFYMYLILGYNYLNGIMLISSAVMAVFFVFDYKVIRSLLK